MGVSLKATGVNFSDENPADAFFFFLPMYERKTHFSPNVTKFDISQQTPNNLLL